MHIIDSTTVEPLCNTQMTEEGYLMADAFAVRTGVQLYRGAEVGAPDRDVVRVYRPPESVFAKDSIQTFMHKPVTVDHPKTLVDSESWVRHAVGEVSTEVLRDGERLKLQLIVKDKAAINQIISGERRQLSAGYNADIVFGDGVTPDGERYDAIQTNIKVNHLALVKRGRAGNCQIGDSEWGVAPINDHQEKEVHVDTKAVSLGDKAVKVAVDDAQTLTDHIANLEKQLGERDGQIANLNKQIMSDEDFNDAVMQRVELLVHANKLAPNVDLSDASSDVDIMKRVINDRLPHIKLDDKSESFVEGVFSTLTSTDLKDSAGETRRHDPMRTALNDWAPSVGTLNITNLDEALRAEEEAWQNSVASMNKGD